MYWAEQEIGKPYQYGAAGPDSFDCSGLTMWAWEHAGVSLPHSSADQYDDTTRVSQADLQPGDLIFENWGGGGPAPGHVGIYVGNGQMVVRSALGRDRRSTTRPSARRTTAPAGSDSRLERPKA